jgi:hypothetical protein
LGGATYLNNLEVELAAIRKEQKAAVVSYDFGRIVALQHQAEGISAKLAAALAVESAAVLAVPKVPAVSTQLTARLSAALAKLKAAHKNAAALGDTAKVVGFGTDSTWLPLLCKGRCFCAHSCLVFAAVP